MDINTTFTVNVNELSVKENNATNDKCQIRIFELYFYILLEYVNRNRKLEIKLNDLIYSDNCIIISGSAECYLRKRFHGYCDKFNIDYRSMDHIIPVDSPYALSTIINAMHNYHNLDKMSDSDFMADCSSVPSSILHSCCSRSMANSICLNPRHYLPLLISKSISSNSNLSAILMEKNKSLHPPTVTPDLKHFNDLSTVDYEVLQAVENASDKWIRKPNREGSEPAYLNMDNCVMDEWGTVMYYELNSRVGDAFISATPIVTIDGYTSPSTRSNRFSLGHLTNVSRSNKIEETRKFIGKGAKFYYIKGELFLECLSDNAIFVQSPLSNITSGWHPATVTKIPPKCNIKVFNEKDFQIILSQYEMDGFEAVFSLKSLCSIRISFVKGWGASYSRQTITTTPCWIEVHLNQPLKCLDSALRQLETPSNQCSSRTNAMIDGRAHY